MAVIVNAPVTVPPATVISAPVVLAPGLTAPQVAALIAAAIAELEIEAGGLTEEQVQTLIETALAELEIPAAGTPQHNLGDSEAPGEGDDASEGYAFGSIWTVDDGRIYLCADAAEGEAVWLLVYPGHINQARVLGRIDGAGPGPAYGLTPEQLQGLLNLVGAIWNDGETDFHLDSRDVTDTASGAGSTLLRRQLGGVDRIAVSKAGRVIAADGFQGPATGRTRIRAGAGERLVIEADYFHVGADELGRIDKDFTWVIGSGFIADLQASLRLGPLGSGLRFNSSVGDNGVSWGATLDSLDLFLRRAAAATLRLGLNHADTPTAQTLKAHDVTDGVGAKITIAGGSGSTAQGDAALEGDTVLLDAANQVQALAPLKLDSYTLATMPLATAHPICLVAVADSVEDGQDHDNLPAISDGILWRYLISGDIVTIT